MTKLDDAAAYNNTQLVRGALTTDHVTTLVEEWQRRHGLVADGKAGPATLASVESATQAVSEAPAMPGTSFHDRRSTAVASHDHGPRAWSSVTGICLHQTACLLGERPERWDTVGAHVGITRSGRVIWLHDFDRLVWHGNSWNNGTVGIEIDGLYAGVEGDPSTVWDDPSTPSREQGMTLTTEAIKATTEAIRWIVSEIVKNGGRVNAIVAHRQASMDRRNDPGSAIWKAIALPLHTELGCSDGGVGFKLGGYAIPEAWDPRCSGIKY